MIPSFKYMNTCIHSRNIKRIKAKLTFKLYDCMLAILPKFWLLSQEKMTLKLLFTWEDSNL